MNKVFLGLAIFFTGTLFEDLLILGMGEVFPVHAGLSFFFVLLTLFLAGATSGRSKGDSE